LAWSELPPGQQLTKEDIDWALDDPDIKPRALHSTNENNAVPPAQLYFGPGFEERLELEMDEYVTRLVGATQSERELSSQELKAREEDSSLLSKMSRQPMQKDALNNISRRQGRAQEKRTGLNDED